MTSNKRRFSILLGVILLSLSLLPYSSIAQDDPMVVGFQFRPIFKNKFFNSGNADLIQNDVNFTIEPTLGFSWGMVVRMPLANKVSVESGINYMKRNYAFGVTDLDSTFSTTANFAIVEYEIPVSAMIHIRLGERFYMNNSAGVSLNMFKRSEVEFIDNISYTFNRKSWMNFALIANIGWEYRTENSGYFYLGSSYQLPFTRVIVMKAVYDKNIGIEELETEMNLGFFTIDLKYYLPSNPD